MTATFDPFVSEFDTPEQEADYTAWLREQVAASLADPRPSIPHDEVERRKAARTAQIQG